MEYKVTFGNADEWVTRAFNRVGWLFFTRPALVFSMLIVILGFASFVMHFEGAIHALAVSPYKWGLFYLQGFLVTLTIPLHELAHAFTTKYYGRKVHSFGLGWLWLGPFAFCDTSDMWLSPKKHRLMVDLAGVYLNAMLAGLAGLAAFFTAPNYPITTILLELFALGSYMIVIANLNTALEFDGYYALMDVLDKPNLRLSAIKWGVEFFSSPSQESEKMGRMRLAWHSIQNHPKEVTYWLCTILVMVVVGIIIPYVVMTYLLAGLFGFSNLPLTIALTLSAVVLSSLGFYKDILLRIRRVAHS